LNYEDKLFRLQFEMNSKSKSSSKILKLESDELKAQKRIEVNTLQKSSSDIKKSDKNYIKINQAAKKVNTKKSNGKIILTLRL
jgi:hypothetical protein